MKPQKKSLFASRRRSRSLRSPLVDGDEAACLVASRSAAASALETREGEADRGGEAEGDRERTSRSICCHFRLSHSLFFCYLPRLLSTETKPAPTKAGRPTETRPPRHLAGTDGGEEAEDNGERDGGLASVMGDGGRGNRESKIVFDGSKSIVDVNQITIPKNMIHTLLTSMAHKLPNPTLAAWKKIKTLDVSEMRKEVEEGGDQGYGAGNLGGGGCSGGGEGTVLLPPPLGEEVEGCKEQRGENPHHVPPAPAVSIFGNSVFRSSAANADGLHRESRVGSGWVSSEAAAGPDLVVLMRLENSSGLVVFVQQIDNEPWHYWIFFYERVFVWDFLLLGRNFAGSNFRLSLPKVLISDLICWANNTKKRYVFSRLFYTNIRINLLN